MTIAGLGSTGVHELTVPRRVTRFHVSNGMEKLQVGSARVVASGQLRSVSAIFTLYTGWEVLTEAGIGSSVELSQFAVDTRNGLNTGLAIQNVSKGDGLVAAAAEPLTDAGTTSTFTLYDSEGNLHAQPVT